jgi:hypothetical protein
MQAPEEIKALQALDVSAQDLLLGRELVDLDAWEEKVLAVTREEVAAYLGELLPTLVIGVTDTDKVPAELAAPIPVFSSRRVDGHVLKPAAGHSDKRVRSAIVGEQGATVVFDGGDSVTVEAAELAGALCSPDGTRHLLGRDGFHVRIDPKEWAGARPAIEALDRALPPELRIPSDESSAAAAASVDLTASRWWMWEIARNGPWSARGWLLLLVVWAVIVVVAAVMGHPAPLIISAASWVWGRRRQKRKSESP